jgi:6-pyruvoyltetrahydropterin/6-carboxytetrahydropterin synthase
MHKLSRQVRFSINPFLPEESAGYNSYASKPPGEGLSIFFELCVELTGEVEATTGFVVNVLAIDEKVRQRIVPAFAARIRADYRQGKHVGFSEVAGLLKSAWEQLADEFGTAKLSKLTLALNPFRKIAVDSEDCEMVVLGEKFEFAATHRLWNNDFSGERNLEVFGKCANPAGHGHNYVVEVAVKVPEDGRGFSVGAFERIVDDEFVKLVDHKNLNVDVTEFNNANPTVENIAALAWQKLIGKFGEVGLHCITVWETDKTCCSYYGR